MAESPPTTEKYQRCNKFDTKVKRQIKIERLSPKCKGLFKGCNRVRDQEKVGNINEGINKRLNH